MIIGAMVGGAIAVMGALDAARKRGRAKALTVLATREGEAGDDMPDDLPEEHVFIVRPGVVLDEATRRAASAHARAQGLLVLDLVSPAMASWRLRLLLSQVDPARFRKDRIAGGASACDALLVDAETLDRAAASNDVNTAPSDAVAFAHLARKLKFYASTEMDHAIAPSLVSPGISLHERRRLLRMAFSSFVGVFVAGWYAFAVLAFVLSPLAGAIALAVRHLDMLLATLGTALSPWDRALQIATRSPVDLASAFGPAAPDPAQGVPDEELRRTYDSLLANGTASFFEPVREDCPLCGRHRISKLFEVGDRYQGKPGRFTLTNCDDCGHVFQNPRLSLEGLSFYYRDFYDGRGESMLGGLFASSPAIYRERAEMVASTLGPAQPGRWLDVGAGHGHFCSIAQEVLPNTRFDGLDLSDSIEDAERRRWVAHGIRGLFPEVAPKLADGGTRYDVVSMSHYLEHTTDPKAEIAAAARVLDHGGLFFIEVPDPECRFGRWLKGLWMPWLQPQHLHFVSATNLERLLREHGFEPVTWHRGEAHHSLEFAFCVYLLFSKLNPMIDGPWRPSHGALWKAFRAVVTLFVWLPMLLLGAILDRIVAPFARRPGWSNAYRVVARRVGADPLASDVS
ncbi:MAG TPA: class I SAM-dependent methyltransferase [Polyangiaceae bacterium]|nr:class I SAM-dependent methyltransferase [Polyangiaceae bacterium]